MGPEIQRETE
jgi:hypothetical protein